MYASIWTEMRVYFYEKSELPTHVVKEAICNEMIFHQNTNKI